MVNLKMSHCIPTGLAATMSDHYSKGGDGPVSLMYSTKANGRIFLSQAALSSAPAARFESPRQSGLLL
jgi:hypothetical protein